jgi:hypothetical protein
MPSFLSYRTRFIPFINNINNMNNMNKINRKTSNKSEISCFKCLNYNIYDEMCYRLPKYPELAKIERSGHVLEDYHCGPSGKYFTVSKDITNSYDTTNSNDITNSYDTTNSNDTTNSKTIECITNSKCKTCNVYKTCKTDIQSFIKSIEPQNNIKTNLEESKRHLVDLSTNVYISGLSYIVCKSLIYDLYPPYSWIVSFVPLTITMVYGFLLIDHTYYYIILKNETKTNVKPKV